MDSVPQGTSALSPHPGDVRAYVDYLRDLGIYDLLVQNHAEPSEAATRWAAQHLGAATQPLRKGTAVASSGNSAGAPLQQSGSSQQAGADARQTGRSNALERPVAVAATPALSPFDRAQQRRAGGSALSPLDPSSSESPKHGAPSQPAPQRPAVTADRVGDPPHTQNDPAMPAPTPFNLLQPLPSTRVAPADRPAALQRLRAFIGDCTRCPLAYAGRHSIVFGDGDASARLMFVGEGPGADEDEQGLPFVGKAGQLLNNMIGAMGLRRDQVYIANIVKCRPPKNRVPEPVEANTCSPFLLEQIDIVQPEVIVALGGTAATYLLGVRQSLASLRGRWFDVRGAKCAVTYHPAFLLRDPRQKGEAWKDLQRVMSELKLKAAVKA